MKNLKRSILSLVLVLALFASLFVPSFAASGKNTTLYNQGQRDEVCTTLEGSTALDYYTGNYTYEYLSTLSKDSLFNSLQKLMRDTHEYIATYDDCHYEADHTDCQNGDGSISLIYTSYAANMSQWNGWNREHVWPKSLGGNSTTGGGADLHQIRPADQVVNSTRNNNKYGNANGGDEVYGKNPATGYLGGYYADGYFEPLDNVKGDVARICLYVYVRWNSDWGADSITKVFQSVDVLLEWCELDPVDTWEMGRNDVVEDMQGNRNVFIDYPEYAWLIFGREVPDDMTTPSGEASGNTSGGSSGGSTDPVVCQHTNKTTTDTATCTTAGTKTVKCVACGVVISTTTSAAKGHSYVSGTCSVCGATQGGTSGGTTGSGYSGTYYIATKRSSGNYLYMSNNLGTGGTKRYQAVDSGLSSLPGSISAADANSSYLFTLEQNSDGTYKIYANGTSGTSNYLGWTSGNSGALVSESSAIDATVDYDSSKGTYTIHFKASDAERYLSLNSTSGNNYFAWYKSGQKMDLVLIPVASVSCSHTDTTTTTVDATCTTAGSITVTCKNCGETISVEEISAKGHTPGAAATCVSAQTCTVCKVVIVAALGHNYVGGVCTRCDEPNPNICYHTDTKETDSATCTSDGVKKIICNNCGEVLSSEVSPAKGHTLGAAATCESAQTCTVCKAVIVAAFGHNYIDGTCTRCYDKLPCATFSVNGVITERQYGATVTLPGEPELPSIEYAKEYTFIGWAISNQDNVSVKPDIYTAGVIVNVDEDVTYYAVYSYTEDGGNTSEGWVKKDISEITATDVVVVTMSKDSTVYALSNDKGTNAAPTAVIVNVKNNALVGDVADNIKWNILNNNGSLTFCVNGDSGKWLYCNSANNGVRVGTNAAKVFTIDSSSGYLKHGGTNRYVGVYTTNPDWRCYTSTGTNIGNQTLAFYVYESGSAPSYTTTLECESYFTGASLNVGADLSLRYHAILNGDADDYTVRFTMNGQTVTVSGEKDDETGKYVFSFCGIAPQCMGDIVKAELIYNSEVIHAINEYSVRHYVIGAIEKFSDNDELMRLLADMLYYGDAAQLYRGYKTDALVSEGVEGLLPVTNNSPAGEGKKDVTTIDTTNVKFIAAGVHFDYINRIYVKIETEDVENVVIKVNGVALEITEAENGKYIAYSDGISALQFDGVLEFTLLYNGSVAQTLTYTVNDYVRAMDNDVTASESMKALALALYRYGESAAAYAK